MKTIKDLKQEEKVTQQKRTFLNSDWVSGVITAHFITAVFLHFSPEFVTSAQQIVVAFLILLIYFIVNVFDQSRKQQWKLKNYKNKLRKLEVEAIVEENYEFIKSVVNKYLDVLGEWHNRDFTFYIDGNTISVEGYTTCYGNHENLYGEMPINLLDMERLEKWEIEYKRKQQKIKEQKVEETKRRKSEQELRLYKELKEKYGN